MICKTENKQTRVINLYIIGSEDLRVCNDCEMKIIRHIEGLLSDSMKQIIKEKLENK
jgi:hypothetical protein